MSCCLVRVLFLAAATLGSPPIQRIQYLGRSVPSGHEPPITGGIKAAGDPRPARVSPSIARPSSRAIVPYRAGRGNLRQAVLELGSL